MRIQCKAVDQDQRLPRTGLLVIQVGAVDRRSACHVFHCLSSSRAMLGAQINSPICAHVRCP